MNFEAALTLLKSGHGLTRHLWDDNGLGGIVTMEVWDNFPMLFITHPDGDKTGFRARDLDLFSDDWILTERPIT